MANRQPKHHWSSEATRLLLKCAVAAYGKCGNNKKGVTKAIAEKFNAVAVEINVTRSDDTLDLIDENKVRHKYDSLRREWVKWESLNNKTGAGWDPNRQTVSGSDEWWDDRLKEFGPSILKFKKSPLEHLELQQQLFQGTHATGQTAYTPAYTPAVTQPEQTPQFTHSLPGNFANPWAFDQFHNQLNEIEDQGQNNIPNLNSSTPHSWDPEPTTQTTISETPIQPRTRHVGSSSGKKRGFRKGRGDMDNKFADLVDYLHARKVQKSTTTESPTPNNLTANSIRSTGNSLSQADMIGRVKRLSEGADFHLCEALHILSDPNKADIFNLLNDDEAIPWMAFETKRDQLSADYKYFLIKNGPNNV